MDRKNVEEIQNDVCRMLEVMQAIHDETSRVIYCPVTPLGVNYRLARHEQLQNALDRVKELLDTDWRYTP